MTETYDMSIHSNADARAWARFFVETMAKIGQACPDEGTMLGWFANAMMAEHDHVMRGRRAAEREAAERAAKIADHWAAKYPAASFPGRVMARHVATMIAEDIRKSGGGSSGEGGAGVGSETPKARGEARDVR